MIVVLVVVVDFYDCLKIYIKKARKQLRKR